MLLSSVSLVAKRKSEKIKESDKKSGMTLAKVPCEQCQKELEEDRCVFQFPSVIPKTESLDSFEKFANYPGDRVTIVTEDAMCLSVEKFYYTIVLREESKTDMTCVFRKKVLESKTVPNGRVETVVFALDCDQDFYITSSSQGDIELNYHPSNPRLSEPDERFFDVFYTQLGQILIQPKRCPNIYLHHLDKCLSTQQFDLNLRCPEEYFFHFSAVPESVSKPVKEKRKICTHARAVVAKTMSAPLRTMADYSNEENNNNNQCLGPYTQKLSNYAAALDTKYLKDAIDRYAIELPQSKQTTKSKRGLSALFLGCFSAKSHRIVA